MRTRAKRSFRRPVTIGNGVCKVELTKGYVCFIDEIDAPQIAACNWQVVFGNSENLPYAKGCPDGKKWVRLHRFLMDPQDGFVVDHIDGDTLNNRRSNLRIATRQENDKNRRLQKNSTTGLKGVFALKNGFFSASIRANGKSRYLGTFSDPITAALAYDAAAILHFGEFAATNATLGLLSEQAQA
jgi:hypothetical protein